MSPKISIIIPCYNIAHHIGRCIDSVLSQTFTDFELLLLNDGSKDETLTILEDYAQRNERIKVFTHSNHGVSYTRNRGIKNARGKYIMFIDGDDYVKPDYLEKHLEHAEEGVWVISGFVNVKDGIEKKNPNFKAFLERYKDGNLNQKDVLKVLKYDSLNTPCLKIYQKEILVRQQVEFDEKVSYQEDLIFNLKYISFLKEVRLIDYFGYYYIEHSSSSSNKYHSDFQYTTLLFQSLVDLIRDNEDEEIVNEFIFHTNLRRIGNLFHQNSPLKKAEQRKEIKEIIASSFYEKCLSFIRVSRINPLLKMILKSRNERLIFWYFSLRKI